LNRINKKILDKFKNHTSLDYESLSISVLYHLLFNENYDLEGKSEEDDILIIESGCKSFPNITSDPYSRKLI